MARPENVNNQFENNKGQMLHNPVWKALRDVPRKTHVCNHCQRYFLFNKLANISKSIPCHYEELCVEG